MKNTKFILLALVLLYTSFPHQKIQAQEPTPQSTQFPDFPEAPKWVDAENDPKLKAMPNGFAKFTFSADLNKTEYLLLQPLIVKLKFANLTDERLKTLEPEFRVEASMEIISEGKSLYRASVSETTPQIVRFSHRLFKPGESVEYLEILKQGFGGYFPKAGKYQIKFHLRGGSDSQELVAPATEITVREPRGINKLAYDFLTENESKSPAQLFSFGDEWDKNRTGEILLETFVRRFGNSIYGDYAAYYLVGFYQIKGENEKAKNLLKKLKASDNKVLAEGANNALVQLEEKSQP